MKADSQDFSPGDITTGEENLLEKLSKEKKEEMVFVASKKRGKNL